MICGNCSLGDKRKNDVVMCRVSEITMYAGDECHYTIEELKQKHEAIKRRYRELTTELDETRELSHDITYYIKKREEEE